MKLESNQNSMVEYGRRINVFFNSIPEIVKDNKLENVNLKISNVIHSDIENYNIFDKPGKQNSKKTIIRFVNALINKKNL